MCVHVSLVVPVLYVSEGVQVSLVVPVLCVSEGVCMCHWLYLCCV